MNNPAINNETIVNYLLGSLPEAETERLDEFSITDDEFAFALNAAEKDLVDAYVQGELTGAALEKFHSHYLASPLRRGRLSFAQAFDALAKKHPTAQSVTGPEGQPAKLATGTKRSGLFADRGFFVTPRLAWGLAFAAITLLIAGSWLALENLRLREQVSQTQARSEGPGTREQELQNELERQRQAIAKTQQELAQALEEREQLETQLKNQAPDSQASGERNASNQQRPSAARAAIASFILTPQLRGVQRIPTVSIPVGADQVSMQLVLEPNDYRFYRVALINQTSNQTLWRSGRLKATETHDSKTLRVSFKAELLKPELYVLRVTGISTNDAPEVIGDYPFRVMKQ